MLLRKNILWTDHGLASLNEGGEVEHSVKGLVLLFGVNEKVFNFFALGEVPFNKFHAGRQQVAPSVAQVVIDNGMMALCYQQFGHSTTYIPRPASHHDFHKILPFSKHFGLP